MEDQKRTNPMDSLKMKPENKPMKRNRMSTLGQVIGEK